MTKKLDEELYQVWDKQWKGSEEKNPLTFLGRLMFKAKKKSPGKNNFGLRG